jgi:ABC-type phosphate/phosphonate transport system ATPase subunit
MGRKIQVVDGSGAYQEEAVLEFVSRHGLADAGVKYSTVAIMGAQSSGKSTLLNAVVCLYVLVFMCFDLLFQAPTWL